MIGYTAAWFGSMIHGLSSASSGIGTSGLIGFCVQPVTIEWSPAECLSHEQQEDPHMGILLLLMVPHILVPGIPPNPGTPNPIVTLMVQTAVNVI